MDVTEQYNTQTFVKPIYRDVKKNNVQEVSQNERIEMKINLKEL